MPAGPITVAALAAQAHAADEWVALQQLDEVAATYLRMMGGATHHG